VHGLAVDRADFGRLLESEPQIALSLLGVLARRLVETSGR
jgi:CRP-like cAMP-binding protein